MNGQGYPVTNSTGAEMMLAKIGCWDPDAEGANQQDDTTQGVQIHCKLSEEALAAFIAQHEQHAEDLCRRAVGGGHQRSVREAW